MATIIPAPALVYPAAGEYALPRSIRIAVEGAPIAGALDDAVRRIKAVTDREVSVVCISDGPADMTLSIVDAEPRFDRLAPTSGLSPTGGNPEDERHVISVTESGIQVQALSVEGLVRGLSSLTQLVLAGGSAEVSIPCQCIVDGPRFAWRGLSFDVVRTFFPPQVVKSVIDMLALYKMNVLHLHLSDDQGWRLEIPSLPALTEIGSTGAVGDRPGGFYSVAEFQDLIDYAAERFVTIVPEIDVPGHAAAIFAAYPELLSAEQREGAAGRALYLDPRLKLTSDFLDTVFGHLATIMPGAYLHVGGDEAFGMPHELYQEFIALVLPIVRARGKRVVGWQEIARGELQSNDVIQYWIDVADVGEALAALPPEFGIPPEKRSALIEQFKDAGFDVQKARNQGAQVLLSPLTVAYFDTPHAEESDDPEQEARRSSLGISFYTAKTTKDSVEWEPSDVMPDADMSGVIGVEAAIWCETVATEADLEMLLLPRLAGFAEKGWSVEGSLVWDEYSTRLADQAPLWRDAGWRFFESTMVDWT